MEDIKIRPNMKIGQLDAESDGKFLSECYINNGLIDVLINTNTSEAIILGRTGAGKTASLLTIDERIDQEHSKLLDLENVFLRYIDNSNIIKFLTDNDVNLDLFYKYLWRHVLTVEFLKLKYPHLKDKGKFFQFINDLKDLIRRPEEKIALNYLEEWSDKYWVETVENIEEIVKSFSNDISAGFEAGFFDSKISLDGGQTLTEEQKIQVKNRAQKTVNNLQISELSKVIDLMDKHVFNDSKKPYYLLIDKLDENWVSIEVKYSLIKGLIEEIRHFRKIQNVKILVSLRVDLYQLTLEKTRSSGFQEDKLLSIIYNLNWTEKVLKDIVDKRITFLFKHQYTNKNIVFEDLFPSTNSRNGDPWQYLIKRTFWRPRDILHFVNYCLNQSIEKNLVDWSSIYKAEKEYSKERLKGLYEEWHDIYPSLQYLSYLLSDSKEIISLEDFNMILSEDKLISFYQILKKNQVSDEISNNIFSFIDDGISNREDIMFEILSCLYRSGLVGLSDNLPDSFDWSFRNSSYKSSFECSQSKWIKIHKMFHQALNTRV
ncbi:P-loop ATPase, Sll1717 family [Psychrobacter jeotgali]|uniref:P-loop ATPase, Sll1717 family n=1 Tax=Psychrobacter jeotgali TaxID=179010 RepID=UPI00191859B3|nr:hypothetical protein [Psychrobacter jeotgali]